MLLTAQAVGRRECMDDNYKKEFIIQIYIRKIFTFKMMFTPYDTLNIRCIKYI